MILLTEQHIRDAGINWHKTVAVISEAVDLLVRQDYAQPIKPYLRYRNKQNRIIAMPAFVGGDIHMAGIKWIASFPGNIQQGLPRAHSIVILNDADTGVPVSIINTALLSIIRTASVSGYMLARFEEGRNRRGLVIGIVGFGPIGQHHLQMCLALLGNAIEKILVYDIRPIDPLLVQHLGLVTVVENWQQAYMEADVFITCTVSKTAYINLPPKAGSLHLNVSLRDYTTAAFDWFSGAVIVDDWEEVCREKTDIEMMHLERGLQQKDTSSIIDVAQQHLLSTYGPDTPVMFNPMGMAVFDIALGAYYYRMHRDLVPADYAIS